jgi:uncharacterized protein YcfL
MKYIVAIGLLALVGCSNTNPTSPTPPHQSLIVDKDVQGMSRNEVIMAIQECESGGLRAVVMTTKRKINGYSSDIVFDVTCAPKFKIF